MDASPIEAASGGESYGVLRAPGRAARAAGVLLRGTSDEVAAGAVVFTTGGAGSAGYVLRSCLSVGPLDSKGGAGSAGRVLEKVTSPG